MKYNNEKQNLQNAGYESEDMNTRANEQSLDSYNDETMQSDTDHTMHDDHLQNAETTNQTQEDDPDYHGC